MAFFHGEYEVTIDAKGRFLLPSSMKKQFAEGENKFMLARGFEKCVNLYPMKTWGGILERLEKLNTFEKKSRDFIRLFLAGATEIELDTAGRMLLPSGLKEYASLNKDVTINAVLKYFEIWDTTAYKKLPDELSPNEYSNLANEVMGGI